MEKIIYRISLDAHKSGKQKTLEGFFAGEILSRRIVISITGGSSGLAMDEDVVAVMYVTRPDGTTSYNGCTVSNNTIVYDVLQADICLPGITEMNLKIMSGEKVLYAPFFALEVQGPRTSDLPATTTPTYTALEEALLRAQQVYNKRLLSIELADNLVFRAYYADGTIYESNALVGAYDSMGAMIDGLCGQLQTLSTALEAEKNRATGAEGSLAQNINSIGENVSIEISRINGANETLSNKINITAEGLSGEITRATQAEGVLSNRITETAEGFTREISKVGGDNETLSNRIQATADSLAAEISRAIGNEVDLAAAIRMALGEIELRVEKDKIIQAINLSAEEGVVIDATKINLAGFLTLAMLSDIESPLGWIFTKNPLGNNSNYLYGTNAAGNNAVMKTGGDVLLAGGLPDDYEPGDNTNGANLQLFHNGKIRGKKLQFVDNSDPENVKFSPELGYENVAHDWRSWESLCALTPEEQSDGTLYIVEDMPDEDPPMPPEPSIVVNIFGGSALYNALVNVGAQRISGENLIAGVSANNIQRKIIVSDIFEENTQYTFIYYATADYVDSWRYIDLRINYTDGTFKVLSTLSNGEQLKVLTDEGKTVANLQGEYYYYENTNIKRIYCRQCGFFKGDVAIEDFVEYDAQ